MRRGREANKELLRMTKTGEANKRETDVIQTAVKGNLT
jgi:hypothetical protein